MLTAVDDARTRVTLELYTPRPLPKRAKGSNPTRGDAPSFLFFVPLASYSFTDQPRFSRSLISRRCTLPRLRIWLWLLLARSVASLHGLAFVRTCSAAPSLCLFRSPVPFPCPVGTSPRPKTHAIIVPRPQQAARSDASPARHASLSLRTPRAPRALRHSQ